MVLGNWPAAASEECNWREILSLSLLATERDFPLRSDRPRCLLLYAVFGGHSRIVSRLLNFEIRRYKYACAR